jgi:hypothetical protein
VIHDVARLAHHAGARETALAAACNALADDPAITAPLRTALTDIARHCAARASSWEQRAPDAAYVAVGRPADGAGEPDAVLDDLSASRGSDTDTRLRAVSSALSDIVATYEAQLAATDARLDGPTASTLTGCLDTARPDAAALAASC